MFIPLNQLLHPFHFVNVTHHGKKQTILIFWTQKIYFKCKTGQMNITIEFSIFELIYAPSFILMKQFCKFELSLLKKGISGPKGKI